MLFITHKSSILPIKIESTINFDNFISLYQFSFSSAVNYYRQILPTILVLFEIDQIYREFLIVKPSWFTKMWWEHVYRDLMWELRILWRCHWSHGNHVTHYHVTSCLSMVKTVAVVASYMTLHVKKSNRCIKKLYNYKSVFV